MYSIKGKQAARIEPVTFSELNMTENDIEEVLRNSIDMICDEEESMLIVGRQVRNEKNGRSDLTAVDKKGNIVSQLIFLPLLIKSCLKSLSTAMKKIFVLFVLLFLFV